MSGGAAAAGKGSSAGVAGESALPGSDVLLTRLAAAHIKPQRFDAVIANLAGDPPLGRALVETVLASADRLVAGVGAAMVACRARRGAIAVRDAAAHKALSEAARDVKAEALQVLRVADTWPQVGLDRDLGLRHAWVIGADELVTLEAAAFARPPLPRRVTVTGNVATPRTILIERGAAERTVESLVAAAGGATASPWLALDGGPWAGRVADPEEPARSSLLLVLPAHHALIARARVSVADQLRRVASACEGCRACTDACPVFLDGRALHPHAVVAGLASGDDRRNEVAATTACIGCGVCTAACPSGLDPAALVRDVRLRLPADLPSLRRGRGHPDRAARKPAVSLLLLRAGLSGIAASQQE